MDGGANNARERRQRTPNTFQPRTILPAAFQPRQTIPMLGLGGIKLLHLLVNAPNILSRRKRVLGIHSPRFERKMEEERKEGLNEKKRIGSNLDQTRAEKCAVAAAGKTIHSQRNSSVHRRIPTLEKITSSSIPFYSPFLSLTHTLSLSLLSFLFFPPPAWRCETASTAAHPSFVLYSKCSSLRSRRCSV